MYRSKRLLTALFIFLSGLLLLPFISLPAEAFSWQIFANAYETQTLTINHEVGKPGSYFKIKGEGFPANATATIVINGKTVGTIMTDADGKFEFELNTAGANDGAYFVTATVNPSATVKFTLDAASPNTWPAEGAATVFNVPPGIAFTNFIYLPMISK